MLCVDVGVQESKNHNSGFWKMMIMVFVLKMKKGDLKGKKGEVLLIQGGEVFSEQIPSTERKRGLLVDAQIMMWLAFPTPQKHF